MGRKPRPDPAGEKSSVFGALVAVMDAAPDVSGGVNSGPVGFQVKQGGQPIAQEVTLQFAAFADANLVNPAQNAALNAATAGTILSSSGYAVLVKTDATGKFTCTMTDIQDEAVWLACAMGFGSPSVDCRESMAVTFSA